ncbi:piggyBac transposable element-derived protein 4-like protein [Lates japonicus]|uniref:PiggyBac transposable element-derived protein 4-like protein n=1 Tax=Lates japonicus TaxID=270547 RepID=A0AAD3RGW1_LATJO|nr:piggyBac transposable element-derived protein 4-like protein [Lates japonicus]
MQRYQPARTPRPGITCYAISHIADLGSSFDFFLTDEIIQVIVEMTNLQGQCNNDNWAAVDPIEIKGYIGLLILAAVPLMG